jgi:hypothetical protein
MNIRNIPLKKLRPQTNRKITVALSRPENPPVEENPDEEDDDDTEKEEKLRLPFEAALTPALTANNIRIDNTII